MSYSIYKRDGTSENKWQELYSSQDNTSYNTYKALGTHKITKCTVLALGGNGTVDDSASNGMAKRTENAVGLSGGDVDLLTIKYRLDPNMTISRGTFNDVEAKDVAQNLLLPLALDKNNNRLPLDIACKNMRLVTIDAYCFGNEVKDMIVNALATQLRNCGYTDDECNTIVKQLVCICYAPKYSQYKNLTYNFYIKSLDDPMFGMNYHYEKFGTDFSPKNIGCGVIEQSDNTVSLYTEHISNENDHDINRIKRDKKWKLDVDQSNYSFTAEAASICHASALEYAILNSIENFNSDTYVPFELNVVAEDCQSIINVFNNSEQGQKINAENERKIQEYIQLNTEVPFKQALKEAGVLEKDIIAGMRPINSFIRSHKGIIIYSGLYKKIKDNAKFYINSFAKKRIATKENVVSLEICHETGFILNNGDLMPANSKSLIYYNALYAKLFEGFDLKDSIKFEISSINGEKCLVISDNYGSDGAVFTKMADLQSNWKTYDNSALTISPTKEQKIVIKNICTQFNISEQNIIYATHNLTV